MKTLITCLIDFILIFGIPYALLTLPQTSGVVTQTGLLDAIALSEFLILAILIIGLTVVRNFSRPGSIINLVAGLTLIGLGIGFFLLLGSLNGAGPRLGETSLFIPVNGTRIALTLEYIGLALMWLFVAGLRAINVVLLFVDARRNKVALKLPPPMQGQLAPPLQVPQAKP